MAGNEVNKMSIMFQFRKSMKRRNLVFLFVLLISAILTCTGASATAAKVANATSQPAHKHHHRRHHRHHRRHHRHHRHRRHHHRHPHQAVTPAKA